MPPAIRSEPSGLSCTLRDRLRAIAKRLAAVVVGILGVAGRNLAGVTHGVLGLAVEILHGAGGLARLARCFCLRIARQISDCAFRAASEFLGRSDNSILVHVVLLGGQPE